jgi:hypothetical protein
LYCTYSSRVGSYETFSKVTAPAPSPPPDPDPQAASPRATVTANKAARRRDLKLTVDMLISPGRQPVA